MKSQLFSLFIVGAFTFTACQTDSKPNAAKLQAAQDSIAINSTIHDYFKWYNDYAFTPESANDDFLNVSGKNNRVTLNPEGLEKRLAIYIATDCISKKWADAERSYITEVSKLWTTTGEELEGLSSDRCFCAQDGDFPEFTTAPASVTVTGDHAKAVIKFKAGSANGENRSYELDKENGKWRISKFDCNIPPIAEPMVGGPKVSSPMVDVVIDKKGNLSVNNEAATMDNLAEKIAAACERVKANGITPRVAYVNESKTAGMGFRQEVQTVIKEVQAKYK